MHQHSILSGLADIRVLTLAMVYFGTSAGLYPLGIWAPQIIKALGLTSLQVGVVNAIPLVVAVVAMVLWARRSDRTNERTWHVVGACHVRQQAQRWFEATSFQNAAHDLRLLSRVEQSRNGDPTAIIMDKSTLQSTPESGHRAGFDGAKKRKGTKVHLAVDTLGHFLAVLTTPASEQDRAQVKDLCLEVQDATGVPVEIAYAVVKRPEASKGFILLPRRWVVERSLAWRSRFRRLGRDLKR